MAAVVWKAEALWTAVRKAVVLWMAAVVLDGGSCPEGRLDVGCRPDDGSCLAVATVWMVATIQTPPR